MEPVQSPANESSPLSGEIPSILPEEKHRLSRKLLVVIFIVIILAIPGFFVLTRYGPKGIEEKKVIPRTVISSSLPPLSPTTTEIPFYVEFQHLPNTTEMISSDKKYKFTLLTEKRDEMKSICPYTITDLTSNKSITLPSLPKILHCEVGYGIFSPFITIGNNGKLVMAEKPGEIRIYDLKSDSKQKITFDSVKYTFRTVNANLDRWVFAQNPEQKTFVITDTKNSVLQKISSIKTNNKVYEPWNILVDNINDGFLITSTNVETSAQGDGLTSYLFSFISNQTLQIKQYLQTDYAAAPGRECDPSYLTSVPGEIILVPRCTFVNPKYLSSDKNLHIKL